MNFYNVVKYAGMAFIALVLVLGYISSPDETPNQQPAQQGQPKFNF